MNSETPAYGLWSLVLVNSVVFILFAYTFFKPRTSRDWRSFSAFSAFLVALFTEMYGFPLTIYFLSGWLQSRYPNIDWFSHDAGHLLEMMFGWKTNPHAGPFHILSFVFIGGGFILISAAWRVLYCVILSTSASFSSCSASFCSGRRCSRSRCSRCWSECTCTWRIRRSERSEPSSGCNTSDMRQRRRVGSLTSEVQARHGQHKVSEYFDKTRPIERQCRHIGSISCLRRARSR